MTHRLLLLLTISTLLLFPGCSYITLLRTQEINAFEAHVDTLYAKQSARIDSMETRQGELLRMIRADMLSRFTEMDKRISSIENGLSENQARLSQIDQKTGEIKRIQEEKGKADSAIAMQGSAAENLFKIAYNDFSAGRWDLAQAGFNDMIKQFPQSGFVEDALYWIAECQYARGDLANAETGFFGLIKTYPASKRVCPALYKLGLIYDKDKKSKSQKMVWDKLLLQCPDSEEAKAAHSR